MFAAQLAQLQQSYDTIIIDGPPILAVADSQILAGKVDGVLMTLRAARCRRDEAQTACQQLEAVGGRLIGVVLNGAKEKSRRYYYTHPDQPAQLAATQSDDV